MSNAIGTFTVITLEDPTRRRSSVVSVRCHNGWMDGAAQRAYLDGFTFDEERLRNLSCRFDHIALYSDIGESEYHALWQYVSKHESWVKVEEYGRG